MGRYKSFLESNLEYSGVCLIFYNTTLYDEFDMYAILWIYTTGDSSNKNKRIKTVKIDLLSDICLFKVNMQILLSPPNFFFEKRTFLVKTTHFLREEIFSWDIFGDYL